MEKRTVKKRKIPGRQRVILRLFLFLIIFSMAFSPGCMGRLNTYSMSLFKTYRDKNHLISSDISSFPQKIYGYKYTDSFNSRQTLNIPYGFISSFDFAAQKSAGIFKNNNEKIPIIQSISDRLKEYNGKKEKQNNKDNSNTGKNNNDTGSKIETDTVNATQSSISSSTEMEILHLINSARLSKNLAALNFNSTLNSIAAARSNDMINRGYFSHTTPDGKNIYIILQENGIGYIDAGENIFYATPPSGASAGSAFSQWISSSFHRANILSGNYSQIGIGISKNSDRAVITIVFTG
ncbi:MAG: CAP domain-containing protein [Actinobacteria bacterium]|nr:CAP domain-containing protein [Actinomycetota bacterium]